MTSPPLHNASVNCLTISPRKKQSMTSTENSLPIPIDLVIEILLRLPAKYIGRCRCVSKLWAYILGRPDFTNLFLTKSFARPQLLFACLNEDGFFFFSSSHQPQNHNEILTAIDTTYLTHVRMTYQICGTINGLICLRGMRLFKGSKKPALALVLCNPTTGESLTLPKMKTRRRVIDVRSYLGFDPVEKQFKVLFMTLPIKKNCEEHQVLTLGNGKLSWRIITCCIPHRPNRNGICINGVLYYTSVVIEESLEVTMVVCFDFRSEKFSVLKVMETFKRTLPCTTTPINYNGRLGLLMTEESNWIISGRSKWFELWVLEDTGKHGWSKRTCVLPPLWKTLTRNTILNFVGMIGTHEIVLSYNPSVRSYVFYYNIERETIKRVRIQGMEAVKGNGCHIFLNHVENVKLIQTF